MKKVRDGYFGEDYSCLGMVANDTVGRVTGDESDLRDVELFLRMMSTIQRILSTIHSLIDGFTHYRRSNSVLLLFAS
jgi:hypothetical protein